MDLLGVAGAECGGLVLGGLRWGWWRASWGAGGDDVMGGWMVD